MRVMHIGKYFAPFKGGIENMMLALIDAQVKAGLAVSVFVHQHEKGMPFVKEQRNGARIYRTPIVAKFLFVPIALMAIWHLRRAIKETNPTVLHAHLPNVTCFLLLFMKSTKHTPLILHWHSDVIGEKPHWAIKCLYPFYQFFERALLKRASRIIVTSENYLKSSAPLMPFKHKCVVIPLGLNDAESPQQTNFNTSTSATPVTINALCIGRLTYYKGHEYLLNAMAALPDMPLELNIVGDGELRDKLQKQAMQAGLTHRVRFLGQVDDATLNDLINECTFLVLSSIERTEAFGLVLLEAMRAAKPCICTDVPGSGMSNVVIHNKTGLVVKHADVSALANALNELTNDRPLCERLGENGRQRFLSEFTVHRVEEATRRLYEAVANASR